MALCSQLLESLGFSRRQWEAWRLIPFSDLLYQFYASTQSNLSERASLAYPLASLFLSSFDPDTYSLSTLIPCFILFFILFYFFTFLSFLGASLSFFFPLGRFASSWKNPCRFLVVPTAKFLHAGYLDPIFLLWTWILLPM